MEIPIDNSRLNFVKLTHHKNAAENKRVDVGRLLFGGASVRYCHVVAYAE